MRPDAFAAAFSLFTSFGYFEDPRDEGIVAENLCCSLRPGGSILIDTDGREVFERRSVPCLHHGARSNPVVVEERELSDDHDWVRARMTRGSGSEELALCRLYSERQLAVLLRMAGFARVRAFGPLDGRPSDAGAQRRDRSALAPRAAPRLATLEQAGRSDYATFRCPP